MASCGRGDPARSLNPPSARHFPVLMGFCKRVLRRSWQAMPRGTTRRYLLAGVTPDPYQRHGSRVGHAFRSSVFFDTSCAPKQKSASQAVTARQALFLCALLSVGDLVVFCEIFAVSGDVGAHGAVDQVVYAAPLHIRNLFEVGVKARI